MSEHAAAIRVGDPLDPETQMGSLISLAHRDRVHGFVERGGEGAEVVAGGAAGRRGRLLPADGRRSAVERARDRAGGGLRPGRRGDAVRGRGGGREARERRPLRAHGDGVDGRPARGHRLAARIKSGTVGINMPYTAFPGIPFGGYKQSGFGRELGLETLDLYLETKSVIVSTGSRPINPFGL